MRGRMSFDFVLFVVAMVLASSTALMCLISAWF